MSIFITRSVAWHRPYRLEGVEIGNILFYRKGEVLLDLQRGWLEASQGGTSGRDMPGLRLREAPRRALKLNLTKGGHFWIKNHDRLRSDKLIDLYIDLDQGDYMLGNRRRVPFFSDSTGTTTIEAVDLTGSFSLGSGEPHSIVVLVAGSAEKDINPLGRKLAELTRYMDVLRPGMSAIKDIIEDPKMVLLIVQAAALANPQKDHPTVQSAVEHLATTLTLSGWAESH